MNDMMISTTMKRPVIMSVIKSIKERICVTVQARVIAVVGVQDQLFELHTFNCF